MAHLGASKIRLSTCSDAVVLVISAMLKMGHDGVDADNAGEDVGKYFLL